MERIDLLGVTSNEKNAVIDMEGQKWIPVSERLPEEEDYYLTYIVDNGNSYFMQVQRFYTKPRILKGIYADSETHWELTKWDDYIVTHWMELPKLPGDE